MITVHLSSSMKYCPIYWEKFINGLLAKHHHSLSNTFINYCLKEYGATFDYDGNNASLTFEDERQYVLFMMKYG